MLLFTTNYSWKGCVGYLVLSWNLPNLYLPGNLLPRHLIPKILHLVCLFAKFQFMLMIHEHQGQTFARDVSSSKEMQLTGVLAFLPWGSLILTWLLRCGRLSQVQLVYYNVTVVFWPLSLPKICVTWMKAWSEFKRSFRFTLTVHNRKYLEILIKIVDVDQLPVQLHCMHYQV